MIHHISIAAENPHHVAQVLAEVLTAEVAPFPVHPGSYIVMQMDEFGTAIEVLPMGTELALENDSDQVQFIQTQSPSRLTATHAAISVPISQARIEQIAAREGWQVRLCDRDGFFEVIEFWLENRLMLELLTPALASKYLEFTHPRNLLKVFASPELAPV